MPLAQLARHHEISAVCADKLCQFRQRHVDVRTDLSRLGVD